MIANLETRLHPEHCAPPRYLAADPPRPQKRQASPLEDVADAPGTVIATLSERRHSDPRVDVCFRTMS